MPIKRLPPVKVHIPVPANRAEPGLDSSQRNPTAPRKAPAPIIRHNPDRWQVAKDAGRYDAPFWISKITPTTFLDPVTRAWIRNANDERAAQEGCKFSEKRGYHTVDWIEDYCTLYEGDRAGFRIDLDDWQFEFFMQVFGWLKHDVDLNRWVRRFKQASVWIPKKNAKSPTLAATGLYLLCGDGEMGQKCYSVARDGNQALIAHQHAMEMVRFSPELNSAYGGDCKISLVTGTITHLPSRSRYMVVKGENKKSTEGYNGSLLVDEVHVVDADLMSRLSRAGISRSEFLHVEMSTAGDSGEGYGFDRYKYAMRVQKYGVDKQGIYAPDMFVLNFSIDQKTPIEKLYDRNFVAEAVKQCNPSIGRIIRPSEPLEDYDKSKYTITELRRYAMYRLNLWLKASANWIEIQDWIDCGKDYEYEQLADFPCVGGLDLSMTRDMTALTLMFAVPHKILGVCPHIFTWFWLPEETAVRYGTVNYDFFEAASNPHCHLTLVPGRVIPYEIIASHLKWCLDNYDLRSLGYDVWNSTELVNLLLTEYGWCEEQLVKIPQGMSHISPPTVGVERLILGKMLRHPQNPLMEWQFNHVQTISDINGNKKCLKPEANDYRKIDGIASLINAWAMFNADESLRAGMIDSVLLLPRKDTKHGTEVATHPDYNRAGREWQKTEERDSYLSQ